MKKWTLTILIMAVIGILIGPLVSWCTDIEKKWGSQVVLAATDAYAEDTDAPDLPTGGTYHYSDVAAPAGGDGLAVDLKSDGYEGAQITFNYTGSAANSNIVFSVFASFDGTEFDDEPYWSITLDPSASDVQQTFIIKDVAYFRIGVKTAGAGTDTFDYRVLADPFHWEEP